MNIKEVQTLIKVEHLVKRYGNRNVVDDLTFTVEKGQIVGFRTKWCRKINNDEHYYRLPCGNGR